MSNFLEIAKMEFPNVPIYHAGRFALLWRRNSGEVRAVYLFEFREQAEGACGSVGNGKVVDLLEPSCPTIRDDVKELGY